MRSSVTDHGVRKSIVSLPAATSSIGAYQIENSKYQQLKTLDKPRAVTHVAVTHVISRYYLTEDNRQSHIEDELKQHRQKHQLLRQQASTTAPTTTPTKAPTTAPTSTDESTDY
jgi:hypothetical protein